MKTKLNWERGPIIQDDADKDWGWYEYPMDRGVPCGEEQWVGGYRTREQAREARRAPETVTYEPGERMPVDDYAW